MPWLNILVLSLSLLGANADVGSRDLTDPRTRCELLLGRTVAAMDQGERPVVFATKGRGPRGLLVTRYPVLSATSIRHALDQGAFDWYDAISVQPNLEAARAHDRKYHGSQRINYVISDVDLTGLRSTEAVYAVDRPAEASQVTHEELRARQRAVGERFERIFGDPRAEVFYFDEPAFDPAIHDHAPDYLGLPQIRLKDSTEPAPRRPVAWDPVDAKLLFYADEVGFADGDSRGPVFRTNGFFAPDWRAVIDPAWLLERKAGGGGLKSGTVKDALKLARQLTSNEWTITMNTNFREVLDLARGMTHDRRGQDAAGERQANSRYLREELYRAALDAHAEGVSFSIEIRDPNGALNTATIGSRGRGGLVAMDTIMSAEPDPKMSLQLRKLLGIVSVLMMGDLGYPFVDVQTITNYTESMRARYIPQDEFLRRIDIPAPPWTNLPRTWRPPAQ